MAVDIVPIEESHIDGFRRALDVVAREKRYLAFLEAPPPEGTRAFVRNNIKRGNPQFVALSAGGVVGWCDVVRGERPIHAHTGVLGVALLPPFRGKGIGAELIRRALEAAKAFGFHRIELTVREENTNAIALYEKFGFATEGLQRDAVRVDGVYGNVVMMAVLF